MTVKCNIELNELNSDFDEFTFVEALRKFVKNNKQTNCANGEINVMTDKHIIQVMIETE